MDFVFRLAYMLVIVFFLAALMRILSVLAAVLLSSHRPPARLELQMVPMSTDVDFVLVDAVSGRTLISSS